MHKWFHSHIEKVEARYGDECHKHDEVPMVEMPNTIVDPWTMLKDDRHGEKLS